MDLDWEDRWCRYVRCGVKKMEKCRYARCGDGTNIRARDTGCCTLGGCFVRCRNRPCCLIENPVCPQYCPPAKPRCGLPPVILPLSCHKPTAEIVHQDFIIHAIRTACRPEPPLCCDMPCGPKPTIINFLAPVVPRPRNTNTVCKE